MSAAPFPSLRNSFLLAMPGLTDPIFAHSITYMCEHGEEGAMGIVINRPLDLCWRDIFTQLKIRTLDSGDGDQPVLAGGPVQVERGFVLHRPTERVWDNSMKISTEIMLTTSLDIIGALASNEGPPGSLVALGYAGWSEGQLERELADNCWLTLPADQHILFDVPLHLRMRAAASKLGIDLDLMVGTAGHA